MSRLVEAADTAGWLAALEGLPQGFGHRPEFVRAAAGALGARPVLWFHDEPGALRAACPLLLREDAAGVDVATPFGFAGMVARRCDNDDDGDGEDAAGEDDRGAGDEALAEAWSTFWRTRGVLAAYVQCAPWVPPGALGGGWETRGGTWSGGPDCLHWDLAAPAEALLAAMAPKHRQLLRKWLREDARPESDQALLRDAFARLYPAFAARIGVGAAYRIDADGIALLASAPGTWFVGARGEDGEVEAVTLFTWADGRGDSALSAATPAGRRHSRGLYWLGALALRGHGVAAMNLGGGIAGEDGLDAFKRRLGAQPVPTRVLRQVFDADGFASACALAGRDPADRFFPPWRAPAA